ncbi:colanic acid biosynthesis acetyltransferase WcaF [Steroidobacter agaridevorans]|uniref:Colanic acid biosynthesis acetyltransferase WcaF n=1 Tax=Steroidobacter agaridevorans TaxID=2695856 RepID=A0A829YNI2_9GAMM|nr:WcaF family extracellular polysaccharide biosynthesis acetyltransferase [Steroidobacter agaridevorans]GFE84238.1 colanic acid biosynthesis acetyltransferase WcaF [Steroidobacter agaridevorans]
MVTVLGYQGGWFAKKQIDPVDSMFLNASGATTSHPSEEGPLTRLDDYDRRGYSPQASIARRVAWYVVHALLFDSWLLPVSAPKVWLLRAFGARMGRRIVIKPRVRIKYPWLLSVGDFAWIGEGSWIDNLAKVTIGAHACVSQDAYLLTGNHDYRDLRFGLITAPIQLEDGAWVGARAIVCPGVTLKRMSVLTAGSILTATTEEYGIYRGNPAALVKRRSLRGERI